MRFVVVFFTFFVFFLQQTRIANAFFTENYKKNMRYGAFKKTHKADIYFGVYSGFFLKNWTPNLATALSPDAEVLQNYISAVGLDAVNKSMSARYSYSIDFNIGLFIHGTSVRQELGFTWYALASDLQQLTGSNVYINETAYSYSPINGERISKIGTYANVYKIMYRLWYDVPSVFSLLKTKWDVFLGGGFGIAFIDGGTYAGQKIVATESENGIEDYSIQNASSSVSSAYKDKIDKKLSFGLGYQLEIGMIANLSQTFAASVSLAFEGTSRPLLTNRFRPVENTLDTQACLDYHVALKIGLLLKATEIAL